MLFRLLVPLDSLCRFRPADCSCPRILPLYLDPTYHDANLLFNPDNWSGWMQYKECARSLLIRPHATAFLMLRGILWRLALEFAPEELLAGLGCSLSTTASSYIRRTVELEDHLGDCVSKSEISMLLGLVGGSPDRVQQ